MTTLVTTRPLDLELTRVIDELDTIAAESHSSQQDAVSAKIREALGPLRAARAAARQYAAGILPEPPPIGPLNLACPTCRVEAGNHCVPTPDDTLTVDDSLAQPAHPRRIALARVLDEERRAAAEAKLAALDQD